MKASVFAAISLVGGLASAHTIFQEVYINGVDQGHLVGLRDPDYDGVSDLIIVCPRFPTSSSRSLTLRARI